MIFIKRTWLILVSSFLVVVVVVVVIVGILASRSKDQLHEHKKSYLSSTENSAGKTLEGAVLQNLKDLLQQSHKAKERDNGKSRPASAPLLYVVSLGRSKYSDNHPLSLSLSPCRNMASKGDTESVELSAEEEPKKGRGVLKVMPLSGVTCYGDHCDFANKIRVKYCDVF